METFPRDEGLWQVVAECVRSHAICLRCADSHGLAGQPPHTCPVCRQPLGASDVCEQFLRPAEAWKFIALSGLSPTVVMECAGRALSFWSYQMTNQMSVSLLEEGFPGARLQLKSSYQTQRSSQLKEYCTELQREVENIWAQANQRITSLTTRIRGRSMFARHGLVPASTDVAQIWNEMTVRCGVNAMNFVSPWKPGRGSSPRRKSSTPSSSREYCSVKPMKAVPACLDHRLLFRQSVGQPQTRGIRRHSFLDQSCL